MHGTMHGAVDKNDYREGKKKNVVNEDRPQDGNSNLSAYPTKCLSHYNLQMITHQLAWELHKIILSMAPIYRQFASALCIDEVVSYIEKRYTAPDVQQYAVGHKSLQGIGSTRNVNLS